MQRDHGHLIRLAMRRLNEGGTLYFSNNFRRFKLDEKVAAEFEVKEISGQTVDKDFQRRSNIHRSWMICHKG